MEREYPHLKFTQHWAVSKAATYELGQADAVVRGICEAAIRPEHHRHLLQVSLVKGAQATTAIEGNTLSEEEVGIVAAGGELPPSKEYQQIEVSNILKAMNQLLAEVAVDEKENLITKDLILRFHRMIGQDLGAHFDAVPGQFRRDERVVGPYRCPHPADVPRLIDRLCDWLAVQFQYSSGTQPFADAVLQAIVTHVYLEWIHPFGDGNGRTGRLLEFYILLRAGNPDIASHILSNFYNVTRPEYYRQLQVANEQRDLSTFIDYAVQGFRDGLLETQGVIQRSQFETAWRSFIYDRFADRSYTKKTVFKRRRELMLAFPMGESLTEDEVSLINPRIAREYGGLSQRTLRRDLEILVGMGLLREADSTYSADTNKLRLQMARRLQKDW